jgi:hypothetical protein
MHAPEDISASIAGCSRIRHGIQDRRALRYAGEYRSIGNSQLTEILVEIRSRCRRDAVGALTEKRRIEEQLENFILPELSLDANRHDPLAKLAHQ